MTSPALHVAPALPVYFDDFPLPDRTPYSIGVDMAVLRSEMSAGNVRQRRAYKNMPQIFSLAFHMHTSELELWQYWVNIYAYDWFFLPLASMYAPGGPPPYGMPEGLVSMHIARFISDIAISSEGFDWWAVTVAAEISPEMFAGLPKPSGFDRIDALHPADELSDAIDGGAASIPSPGGPIDGGTLDTRPSLAALARTQRLARVAEPIEIKEPVP